MGCVQSQDRRQLFTPDVEIYDDYRTIMTEVREKAGRVRGLNTFRAWYYFHCARMRGNSAPTITRDEGVRENGLVLKLPLRQNIGHQFISQNDLETGFVEMIVGVNEVAEIVSHHIVPTPNRTVDLDTIRLTATKWNFLGSEEQERLYRELIQPDEGNAEIWGSKANMFKNYRSRGMLYKVIINKTGSVLVFDPNYARQSQFGHRSGGQHFIDDENIRFAKRIVGLPFENEDQGVFRVSRNDVIIFRTKKRETPIGFPFQAAVWLEAFQDFVPARLHSFAIIVVCIAGAILPFIIFCFHPVNAWDLFERFTFISGYFLTLLSVRELLASKGAAATSVLRGFILPDRLIVMSRCLGVSVPQLLLLARLGGAWTEALNYQQLSFLGRGGERHGVVRRDEFGVMNTYAVGEESFNKEFAFLTSGVHRILGSEERRGGECENSYSEEQRPESAYFVRFDETKHYLA